MTDPLEEHRKTLAVLIRRFRKAAGLSGVELADRLGWSQSRISRMETARQGPSEFEAKEMARALGLSRKEQGELLDAIRMFNTEFVTTRSVIAKGAQQRQDEIRAIEADTKHIRSVTLMAVPGLLQVPEYIRGIARVDLDAADWTDDEIEGAVEMRVERQRVLRDKNKSFAFLLSESALWTRYGSSEALRVQLDYLAELENSSRFRFGVIPRSASLSVMPLCGFKIYDDRLVQIDGITGEFNLTEEEDVCLHETAFDRLSSASVTGRAARRIIHEVISELV